MHEQCKGLTRSGERCKIKAGLVDGYCRLHREQTTITGEDDIRKSKNANHRQEDSPVSEVASNVTKSTKTILLVITAIISIIFYMVYKRRKKRGR